MEKKTHEISKDYERPFFSADAFEATENDADEFMVRIVIRVFEATEK